MKNIFKLLCIFYAFNLLVCASSCSTDDSDENSTPTLKSIQVTEAKLDYCVGDAPKASVIAIYSDGHNEIVTDKVKFTPSIIEKNTSFINCFYSEGGNSANYTLRINVGERTLKSIETVELSPQIEGEKADMSKLIVLANYSNYDVEKIDLNEIEYNPIDLVTADDNGKATLTITYKEMTYNISLSVTQKSNASITLKSVTAASLKSYTQEESFDKKQTVVLAVYSDGSTKDISSEAEFRAPERFSLGENDILFTYTEGTITKSCTLKIMVFANSENESSTLLTPPTLTALEVFGQNAYTSGKSLDKSKVVLLALYSDGSIKKIESGFDFSPEIFNEGTKNIEFSYTENNITVKYTFPITVQCETFDPTEGGTIPAYNQTLLNTYGIGFGFNVITAPYFDTSYKSTVSILNPSKLTEKYVSKVKNSNNTTTGEVINNTISGYAESYSNSLNIPDISLNGGVKVFTASIGVSFKSVDTEKFTSKSNQLFYTHYDYRKPYYVQVVNITSDKFQQILSDNFLEDVKGVSPKTKGLSVEEQAAYIIDTYGTHLIAGIYLGGRYEYSYAFASDSSEHIGTIEKNIGVKCSLDLGISDTSGGISSEVESGEAIETVIKSGNVESQFNAVIMGGASNSGGWTVGSMKDAYQEWRKSFNDVDSETGTSNWVPVGVTNNGLLGIWELIPQGYETLANAIIEKYRTDAEKTYNTIIEKYAPKANIPQPGTIDSSVSEEDSIVLLDFSSCYSNSPQRDFWAPTNFSDEKLASVYKDGVITVANSIDGVEKTKYIIKGAYNQKYNNYNETISSKMLGLLIDIQAENPIEIELVDMSFQAMAGKSAILYSGEKTPEITLKITGENTISPNNNDVNSKPVSTIFFDKHKQLKLTGEGNLTIRSISGHLGARGVNAGENGGDGTDGARAISAGYLTIDMTGNLTCYGGEGGNGGNGAKGKAADSSTQTSAGMGGNGGSGGKGGSAIYITNSLNYKQSGIITLHSGKGGYGGDGGAGGDNVNGGNAGAGGRGGNGGASDYCIFVDTPFEKAISNVKLTPHKGGAGGNGGNGGNATGSGKCGAGGTGGNGGDCRITAGITECTIEPIASSSSGNGGNGGNCGAASKNTCHSTPGNGGVCGKVSSSVAHSVPAGTNGNSGVSGGNQ